MTRDDIIKMGQEAGFRISGGREGPDDVLGTGYNLERFAALVAAAEREACAQVCEENMFFATGEQHADAIRARGEK